MGMFDTVQFIGPSPITCAAGHENNDFQTKDLDCSMQHYTVIGGEVYEVPSSAIVEKYEQDAEGKHWLQWKRLLGKTALSGTATIYTTCKHCLPVLTLSNVTFFGDRVQEHYPRVENEVEFKAGRLVSSAPTDRNQTREDVKKEITARCPAEVLDDTERLAVRHFELLKS